MIGAFWKHADQDKVKATFLSFRGVCGGPSAADYDAFSNSSSCMFTHDSQGTQNKKDSRSQPEKCETP